jgi:hypothetical protein
VTSLAFFINSSLLKMLVYIIPITAVFPLLALAISATGQSSSWHFQHLFCPGPPGVYVVEPSEGKGLGVFAAHDLEIGDIVMRESPIITIQPPKVAKGDPYPMTAITKLVRKEFEELSSFAQEEVLSLTYHSTAIEKETMDELGIIFRTNAYNTGDRIGLFPKIARINHGCRPNTSYYWNEKLNKRIVYVTRKIKAGEEFFVSYISLLLTQEERQKQLDRYGFKCHCEACAQGQAAQEASDYRRTTMRNAFAHFEPQLSLAPPQSQKGKEQALQNAKASAHLLQLVQDEGLADYYARAYRIAAISHARIGDWRSAAIWSNKAYEAKYMEDPQSPRTLELEHLTGTFITNWEAELMNQSST